VRWRRALHRHPSRRGREHEPRRARRRRRSWSASRSRWSISRRVTSAYIGKVLMAFSWVRDGAVEQPSSDRRECGRAGDFAGSRTRGRYAVRRGRGPARRARCAR
jgi:hypothetical protein